MNSAHESDPLHGCSPATLCVHAGYRPGPASEGVVAGIERSTTFQQNPASYAAIRAGRGPEVPIYARYGHPTGAVLERRIAALEGTPGSVAFSSGSAALHAALRAALSVTRPVTRPGAGAVAHARQLYGGSLDLLQQSLAGQGTTLRAFDVGDLDDLERVLAAGDVGVVLCESVSNPTLVVADLPAIAERCRAQGATLIVDATFSTPIAQRAAAQGADLVMHSATKYLGGHSDVTAGVVSGNAEWTARVWELRKLYGGCLDPQAAFLLDRGLKTLALRMRAHAEGATRLAAFLESHAAVERVHYPGLQGHPSHDTASRLLSLPGGVVAFELGAGDEALPRFLARLRLALDAPSLGGVETLVSLPTVMSHAKLSEAQRREADMGPGLVRVSVGIEDPDDVIADFERALAGLSG